MSGVGSTQVLKKELPAFTVKGLKEFEVTIPTESKLGLMVIWTGRMFSVFSGTAVLGTYAFILLIAAHYVFSVTEGNWFYRFRLCDDIRVLIFF
jgi:hypothetical protein